MISISDISYIDNCHEKTFFDMNVVMIHEVHDWMLDVDLSSFDTITFDDGLYSQYKHYKHFLQFGKPLHFFISTDIICSDDQVQSENVVACAVAHQDYFEQGDRSNYMTWSQILDIYNTPNCYVGGHSHTHPRLTGITLTDTYREVKRQCGLMFDTFNKHNIVPQSFAYPYNYAAFGYDTILRAGGITQIFGRERTPIEALKL